MKQPLLLIHICCAPCATTVVRRLRDNYDITGFFYNPNIFPEDEYQRRREAVERLAEGWGITVDFGEYEYERFRERVRGLEAEPEGGRRCAVCYRLRLERGAARAKAIGAGFLATTLTVGPNKKAAVINQIGEEVCTALGVKFVSGDWKRQDGFKQSVEISRSLGLYRQHYCGCEFSRQEK